MEKSSSRALIIDSKNQVYLVTHNYLNPKNDGKWSTVGGRREPLDSDDRSCLIREIGEEFGEETLRHLDVVEKIGSFTRPCEINEQDTVSHHFFVCRWTGAQALNPSLHQSEIKDGRFFTLAEVEEIAANENFVLGCEARLIRMALQYVAT